MVADASAWVDAAIVSVLAIVTYVVVGSGATLLAERRPGHIQARARWSAAR